MGGVMQSGVTSAQHRLLPSVWHRLRTGTHSSNRKVRPNFVSIHSLLHLSPLHSSSSLVFIYHSPPSPGPQLHPLVRLPITCTALPSLLSLPSLHRHQRPLLFHHLDFSFIFSDTPWLPLSSNHFHFYFGSAKKMHGPRQPRITFPPSSSASHFSAAKLFMKTLVQHEVMQKLWQIRLFFSKCTVKKMIPSQRKGPNMNFLVVFRLGRVVDLTNTFCKIRTLMYSFKTSWCRAEIESYSNLITVMFLELMTLTLFLKERNFYWNLPCNWLQINCEELPPG